MLKDPLHHEETPYDLFDLEPDVFHGDVLKAMQRFMCCPENRQKIPLAQTSRKTLMNSRDRISVDILYYCTRGLCDEINIKNDIDDLINALVTESNELLSDAKKREFPGGIRDISVTHISMIEVIEYDGIQDYKLEIKFDK